MIFKPWHTTWLFTTFCPKLQVQIPKSLLSNIHVSYSGLTQFEVHCTKRFK